MPRGDQRVITFDIPDGRTNRWHGKMVWDVNGTVVEASVKRKPVRDEIIDTTCRVVDTERPATVSWSRALVVR